MVWKSAVILGVYSLIMLAIGVLTFLLAPASGRAFTALIVPGVFAVLAGIAAIASLRVGSDRRLGVLCLRFGLVVPLVAAIGSTAMIPAGIPMRQASTHVREVNKVLRADGFATIGTLDPGGSTPDSLDASGATIVVPKRTGLRPNAYKVVGQAAVAGVSALAFVSLLLHRPTIPKADPNRPRATKPEAIKPVGGSID